MLSNGTFVRVYMMVALVGTVILFGCLPKDVGDDDVIRTCCRLVHHQLEVYFALQLTEEMRCEMKAPAGEGFFGDKWTRKAFINVLIHAASKNLFV